MTTRRQLLLGLAGLATCAATRAPPLDGRWLGALASGAARLPVELVLSGATGTLLSVDQMAAPVPVAVDQGGASFQVPAVSGEWRGRRVGDHHLDGTWTQPGFTAPLSFVRDRPLTDVSLREERLAAGSPAVVAAAVARGGQPRVWVDGVRAAGGTDPVTATDRWHLGSITKSFTATLAARAVDRGLLRWEDRLGALLGADVGPAYRDVTLRHLLCHRSGLPANLASPPADRRAYAAAVTSLPPVGPAGSTFLYSNAGYVVVGAVLEAVGGAAWEVLLEREVLTPLGLASGGFGPPDPASAPQGHRAGMLGRRVPAGDADNPAVIGPAGRLHLAPADVLRYLVAHRDRTELLTPASWAELHSAPLGGSYGYGWVANGRAARWHNGSNTFWYAEVTFDPDSGVAAFAAANDGWLAGVRPEVDALVRGAARAAS